MDHYYVVEKIRKATIWSAQTLLEIVEDADGVTLRMTQHGKSLTMRLTRDQWSELQRHWYATPWPPG